MPRDETPCFSTLATCLCVIVLSPRLLGPELKMLDEPYRTPSLDFKFHRSMCTGIRSWLYCMRKLLFEQH